MSLTPKQANIVLPSLSPYKHQYTNSPYEMNHQLFHEFIYEGHPLLMASERLLVPMTRVC